jgi:hypothetical protein
MHAYLEVVPVRDGKDERRREERMYVSVREGKKVITGSPSENLRLQYSSGAVEQ